MDKHVTVKYEVIKIARDFHGDTEVRIRSMVRHKDISFSSMMNTLENQSLMKMGAAPGRILS